MSNTPQKDGGPAYPHGPVTYYEGYPGEHTEVGAGMSLRDYFAGQVLAGYDIHGSSPNCPEIAEICYAIADAMLEKREK